MNKEALAPIADITVASVIRSSIKLFRHHRSLPLTLKLSLPFPSSDLATNPLARVWSSDWRTSFERKQVTLRTHLGRLNIENITTSLF